MVVTNALVLGWMVHLAHGEVTRNFESLAEGIVVASNEDSDPYDAAASLVAVAYYESRFDPWALSKDNDPVHAIGAFQISTEWIKFPVSPEEQAKTALWLIRGSMVRCGTLAEYTSGSCHRGLEEASRRARLAARLRFDTFVERGLPVILARAKGMN